jgi:hypothetical protein
MKALLLSLVSGIILLPSAAVAQNEYVLVAKGSEGLIRAYDTKVRDVKASIPATPGGDTACGQVGQGELTAFYCSLSRSIYITEKTLRAVGDRFGPEGIATLVAHEYAHARLHAVQGLTRNVIWSSVIDELQADCVSGVYMKSATPIELTNQMVQNSADFVESVGDYLILEKDWHGTPEMRRAAFLQGYNGGELSSCVATEKPAVNQIIERSTDTIQKQVKDPESELNRLLQWGNNLLSN